MNKKLLLLTTIISGNLFSLGAYADQYQPSYAGVSERSRPELDAPGIPMGPFNAYPVLEGGAKFTDNVYASGANKVEDFVYIAKPRLNFRTNWSRHAVDVGGYGKVSRYQDETSENKEEWGGHVRGRVDVARDTYFSSEVKFDHLVEDRSSLDAVNSALSPTELDVGTAGADFKARLGRLIVSGGGQYAQHEFQDAENSLGTSIDQDFRDRSTWKTNGGVDVEFTDDFRLIVRGEYNQRDYELAAGDPEFIPGISVDRDSSGYKSEAGVAFRITNLISGELRGGYMRQDYQTASLNDIEGISWGANLQWDATPLTTVKFSADRRIEDATSAGLGGRLVNNYSASIDHELLRNILVSLKGGYSTHDFVGSLRNDELINAAAAVRYMINRNVYLQAEYEFTDRDSSIVNLGFQRNVGEVSLGVRF